MELAPEIIQLLTDQGFRHTYTNQYTGTDRFVKRLSHLRARNRTYINCSVVIETYAENFLTANVFGYAPKTQFVHNITRDLFPGVYHVIPADNVDKLLLDLQDKPLRWGIELAP